MYKVDNGSCEMISVAENLIYKPMYQQFEKTVDGLFEFLHIFKPDLKKIEIEKKKIKSYLSVI